jgi:hypothetical protein
MRRRHAELERAATRLLAADRKRRAVELRRTDDHKTSEPIPEVPPKWVKLGDLKSALRKRGGL